MNNDHFDHRLLVTIVSRLDEDTISHIRRDIASHEGLKVRFESVLEEAQDMPYAVKSGIESDWQTPSDDRSIAFVNLLNGYFDRRKEQVYKEKKTKLRVSDVFTVVNNNAKWSRMKADGGRGEQYHDDVRRVCIVLHLTYLEATEFLWYACQPFDRTSKRDKVIADCLCKGIYDEWKVNEKLEDSKLEPLFTI